MDTFSSEPLENFKKKRFVFCPIHSSCDITISHKTARENPLYENLSFEDLVKQSFSEGRLVLYRYLKTRPRSIYECVERLKKEGFLPHESELIIDNLIEQKLLNDITFTEFLIIGYQKSGRPLGELSLKAKLREKGVKKEIYEPILSEYLEKNEEELVLDALQLVKRNNYRFEKAPNLYEKKQKIFEYLYRRGFTSRIIARILEKY